MDAHRPSRLNAPRASSPSTSRRGAIAPGWPAPPIVTLLTDFGTGDGYVGAMKGVLATFAPHARAIDICHHIPPQDVRRAGIVWASAVEYFPPGTVHVAVVDPGVGTGRKILAVAARRSFFIAPDNGILGLVLARREIRRCVAVTRRDLFLETVSRTFHGRDIFAPVAARLATGARLEDLGPRARPERWDSVPRPRRRQLPRGGVEERGEVIAVDSFGNLTTSLRPLERALLVSLDAGSGRLARLHGTYGQVREGDPLALVGSAGYLEVAVNRGRADATLGLRVGDAVRAVWRLRR